MDTRDPGLIYDLYTGVFRPQIVQLALQLDVITPLSSGSLITQQVSKLTQVVFTQVMQLRECWLMAAIPL